MEKHERNLAKKKNINYGLARRAMIMCGVHFLFFSFCKFPAVDTNIFVIRK